MIPFAGHAGTALIIAWLFNLDPLLVLIGSVLPDIDMILILFKTPWEKAHRKITHSLLFLLPFIILSLINPFFIPILIGLITHFITDLDHWGIPLFYPFNKKDYSIIKIKHNKKNSYSGPKHVLFSFFKKHDYKFWIEFALLAIGITLNWNYITNFIGAILGLY